MKGDLRLNGDVNIIGDWNTLNIEGNVSIPDGGWINYEHKSSVSLIDDENVVQFTSFSDTLAQHRILKRRKNALHHIRHCDSSSDSCDINNPIHHRDYLKSS